MSLYSPCIPLMFFDRHFSPIRVFRSDCGVRANFAKKRKNSNPPVKLYGLRKSVREKSVPFALLVSANSRAAPLFLSRWFSRFYRGATLSRRLAVYLVYSIYSRFASPSGNCPAPGRLLKKLYEHAPRAQAFFGASTMRANIALLYDAASAIELACPSEARKMESRGKEDLTNIRTGSLLEQPELERVR